MKRLKTMRRTTAMMLAAAMVCATAAFATSYESDYADVTAGSKDCVKTVQRHVWKDYEDLADDARYTPKYQDLYRQRKETIERVFADAKEKHAMRYTQYRGLAQETNWVKLKFAAMNLKKFARWKWNDSHHFLFSILFSRICAENLVAA